MGVFLQLRVPLWGGVKARNQLEAARLRQQEAMVSCGNRDADFQWVDTAVHKSHRAPGERARGGESYQTMVDFNEQLLQTVLARLELGKIESRKVLEVEADLFESRNSVVESLVTAQRAVLEMQLLEGSLLQQRRLDFQLQRLEATRSGSRARPDERARLPRGGEAGTGCAPRGLRSPVEPEESARDQELPGLAGTHEGTGQVSWSDEQPLRFSQCVGEQGLWRSASLGSAALFPGFRWRRSAETPLRGCGPRDPRINSPAVYREARTDRRAECWIYPAGNLCKLRILGKARTPGSRVTFLPHKCGVPGPVHGKSKGRGWWAAAVALLLGLLPAPAADRSTCRGRHRAGVRRGAEACPCRASSPSSTSRKGPL